MSKNTTITIIIVAVLILAGFSLYQFTNSNSVKPSNSNSTNTNSMSMSGMMNMDKNSQSMAMDMSKDVKDDMSFIENMIPHHEEAVTSSKQVLLSTKDTELKTFAQNVITAQAKEINEMKSWYKKWYGKDYTPNSNYQVMMTDMNGKSGIELDKAYTKGMVMHHQGAIEMAKKIKTISKRSEILTLADDIISSQSSEVTTLQNWLMNKYGDHSMMGM